MNQLINPLLITMTKQKNNDMPAWDSLRCGGLTDLTAGGSLLVPPRPASEGDEDVLASIARRHVSSLGIRRAVSPIVPPVVNPVESPLPDSTGLREAGPKDVFYVRRAICKSPGEPARGEPARGNLARGRIARVLIVYLVSMAALTVLAVAMCFVTRLDGHRSEEFAQTRILVDRGRNSPKAEDPETETPGYRNTVIVVDK